MAFTLLCLLVICFSFFPYQSLSDPRATEVALICANSTAAQSDRQEFVANFLAAVDALTPQVAATRFGRAVNGTGNTTVYAFGECMRDLSPRDCNLCFAQCKTQILRCLPFQRLTRGGRLFYDGCYLRYDSYMFFNEGLTSVDRNVCGANDSGRNQTLFRQNILELVGNLSIEAPMNDGFAVGSVNRGNVSVYGLAQCWEFVSKTACAECLAKSLSQISSCPPKEDGRVLNSGCYLRYSPQKFFYNSSSDDSPRNDGRSHHLAAILAATFGGVALILFLATFSFWLRKRVMKKRREKKQLGNLLATVNNSKLNISYEILEKATHYFHESNKLGQGGSGSVYKGILPDGQAVAIKRLFFNTAQWVDHFFNEVNLISGIDHKNLVKLLGCSITGPESLLVYEYAPNHSLHDYLFVQKNVVPLTWEHRCQIILGVAEGLAYLHEQSQPRIIHRDIKLSNVLLDEDLKPKIADFGHARLFPENRTHISTAIAGTLGYMAPEYIVRGKLTEKADVYSFGILVIEVVCRKRNSPFSQNQSSVLQMVWYLYGLGRLSEAVDASMGGKFEERKANRILQIGLLCVQASAQLRPSMSMVVKMMNDDLDIPEPTQPPFLSSEATSCSSNMDSNTHSSGNDILTEESWIEPR